MSLQDETGFAKKRIRTKDKARERATEAQWLMVEQAINAFAAKYPHVWKAFIRDTDRMRDSSNKYAEMKTESGKKMPTERRWTATFPSANLTDPNGTIEVDRLDAVLEGIIPALCHKDSVNFAPFLKRFPIFNPAYKFNV